VTVRTIEAEPAPLAVNIERAALVIIDMQRDFLLPGGFGAALGNDVSRLNAAVGPCREMLAAARKAGLLVIHTREGHRPDLSDLPQLKAWRARQAGVEIGSVGPLGRVLVRGEDGWQIVPELAPRRGEIVVDKAGYSAFYATDLERILLVRGIRRVIFTGVTTDVCVHSTLRSAVDRGYECLVVEDACAATLPHHHRAAIGTITTEGGIFGAVAGTEVVCHALLGAVKELAAS
jgi:nicotinamidase-related amidase